MHVNVSNYQYALSVGVNHYFEQNNQNWNKKGNLERLTSEKDLESKIYVKVSSVKRFNNTGQILQGINVQLKHAAAGLLEFSHLSAFLNQFNFLFPQGKIAVLNVHSVHNIKNRHRSVFNTAGPFAYTSV